jgi:outer membrane protein
MNSRSIPALQTTLLSLALALLAPAVSAQISQVEAAQLQAQAAPASSSISLPQVLGTLKQAPGWRSAELQYRSASQNLDAARARAGLGISAGATVGATKAPIDGDWTSSTTLTLQAAINVLPWSAAQGGVRQAMRGLYRAGLDQRDAQATLALTVVQGYLSARQAAATLSAAQQQQALAGRQLEVARAQQQAGTSTQEGVLAAQATQEQAAQGVTEASSSLENALRQLYNTLGTPAPDLSNLAALSFSSRPAVPAAPSPLDAQLTRAAQGRSEILKASSNQQDAQAALEAARLDRTLPDLSLNVQYGQLGVGTGAAGNTVGSALNFKTGQLSATGSLPLNPKNTDAAGNTVTPPTSLSLGLSGSYAILNPVADAAVQSALTSLESAQLSLATARSGVDLDVRQKYAAFQNALLALSAPRTLLTRAQTALKSTQAREAAGLSTAIEVDQATLGVLQAQNTLDTAINAAYLASLNLSVATAEFSPALIAVPDGVVPHTPNANQDASQDASRLVPAMLSVPNTATPNTSTFGGPL